MFLKKLLHRPAALVMHLALFLIIAGALATAFSARRGMLHLRVGDVASSYADSKTGKTPLPFSLRLDDFSVRCYPGTETPSDYRSEVSVLTGDGALLEQASVSMNRILSCRGYRFYQSSYDNDSLGSTFTVSRDPWGIGLVYSGYALFLLGFLLFFFTDRKFKALGRKVTGIAAALVLLLSVGVPEAEAKTDVPESVSCEETAGIPPEVQAEDCLPSPARIRAEKLYNSFPPLFPIPGIFLVVGLVLALWCISYFIKGGEIPVRVRLAALVLDGVLWAFLTLMLALLWIASGHVPLSNGAETMMSIAWTVLLGGLVTGWKFRLLPPYALVVASLALMVAAMGQPRPGVTLLAPVLSSPLLSVHVSLMMLSYAILALIMINSASALGVYAFSRGRKMDVVSRLADVSMLRLYFGVFFLAAGIITGSVWANVSWGCYWNWDPKETWALITLLIYAIAVHRSDIEALRNPVVFHIFLLLAFISVLFTYFGVNYLLGGMHSYAS